MIRYYVTMTWDNFPEGGSFGTVVDAENTDDAEHLCRMEMAEARLAEYDDDSPETLYSILSDYEDEWHVVDCFDLDEFIERHDPASALVDPVATAAMVG